MARVEVSGWDGTGVVRACGCQSAYAGPAWGGPAAWAGPAWAGPTAGIGPVWGGGMGPVGAAGRGPVWTPARRRGTVRVRAGTPPRASGSLIRNWQPGPALRTAIWPECASTM